MRNDTLQAAFDRFTALAGRLFDVPVVCVSFVDARHRLLTSCSGLPEPVALLVSYALCRHVVASRQPLVVSDAGRHPLTANTPAVREGFPGAYAGLPLIDSRGRAVGTLCVMDGQPRQWSEGLLALLRDIAALLVSEIELHAPCDQRPVPGGPTSRGVTGQPPYAVRP